MEYLNALQIVTLYVHVLSCNCEGTVRFQQIQLFGSQHLDVFVTGRWATKRKLGTFL
jgi:hypothetical protein